MSVPCVARLLNLSQISDKVPHNKNPFSVFYERGHVPCISRAVASREKECGRLYIFVFYV
jgi:hypothetical protein